MHPKYTTQAIRRFWSRVDMSGDCWMWTGGTSAGYGRLGMDRHVESAHRLAYELTYGPIPPGMCVCHHCDVRTCCRPDHLFLGTSRDNTYDMMTKDRMPRGDRHYTRQHPEKVLRGEAHHKAKLTDEQVIIIRRRFAAGESTCPELAREYNVRPNLIYRIVNGETWKHLPCPERLGDRSSGDLHYLRQHPEQAARGEKHPKTHLTDEQVLTLRRRYAAGEATMKQLMREYGVSDGAIRLILGGKTWKHLL